MRNKPNDIPYLGCREDKIRNACPKLNEENFKHLHTWITDRYDVHVKKDVMRLAAPWTTNPIIREFRFTNVRREHDKETKWVIENICNADLTPANKWMNLILFRMINKSETCRHFMPFDFDSMTESWNRVIEFVSNTKRGYVFFTNAFKTSGVKGAANKELGVTSLNKDPEEGIPPLFSVIGYCCKLYAEETLIYSLGQCVTAQQAFDVLNSVNGLGYFLAYQILIDSTYCEDSLWSENEFVVAGPGARKGLDLVFDDRDGMTYEECLFWLRDNWVSICMWLGLGWNPDTIFVDLPPEDRYMNVMSLQNCHCEISKYIRAVNGTGRPRNKYKYGG
jgi:hypothetical protein